MTDDPKRLRRAMVAALLERGDLTPAWQPAFEDVARHRFIPDVVWQHDQDTPGADLLPLRRADDPGGWLAAAYADDAVITQVDDGKPDERGRGWLPTSSASAPTMVARMLAALDIEPGMRVLEIGSGTGWNAALLAHRVGAENVTTLEVDPAIADHARAALDAAGYDKVCLVATDGVPGWPAGAPYDRLIATVGAAVTPYHWVQQVTPGGRLVVPLANTYEPPGVAVLDRHEDGTATGSLGACAVFMSLRSQRVPRRSVRVGEPDTIGTTELHPYRWAQNRDAAVAIGQRVNGVSKSYREATPTTGTVWLLDVVTDSWASVDITEEPPYPVNQSGQRRLFDEVADAYRWWQQAGEPAVTDWTVTVGPHGQRMTLPD
ncbi:rRNA adenine N-6-methyltransferase family protein [Pseudonocardia acaciae]|uniref:rRNA adenine N-6-methyltransferase family protein n=1 Tax=Pseudonocardia acaciae TaxID=551276 RepID=UPI000AA5C7E7|nr:rRNA adenine N-6-methyltransferase family protein [Pseudonocardia acaciae]